MKNFLQQEEAVIYCPICDEPMIRIPRKAYMRLLPFSRHMFCKACHDRFLVFMGQPIKLDRA